MSIAYGTRQPCDHAARGLDAAPCRQENQRWVLIVSVLGSSLAFIEGAIVNLALPALQQDLGLDAIQLQWVVTAYLLTLSALILIGGAAGDRFGLRSVFLAGLALFGVASAFCAAAASAGFLIGARAVQGAGAAFLVPTSLALINVFFAPEDRARAIGIWAGASALTSAAAPLLGGVLVDLIGWRAVFFLITPLAVLAGLLAVWKIPARRAGDLPAALDWAGAALLAPGLALLTLSLGGEDSQGVHLGYLTGGVVLLALFLGHERRARSPMMPLDMFESSSFLGANVMTVLLYFAIGGAFYLVPFNLIQVQGYSALQAGAAFLPMTLLIGFGSGYAGTLAEKVSPGRLLTMGAVATTVGLILLALPDVETTYLTHWFPGIAIVGLGMTLCVSPLTTVVMAAVTDAQSGTASGINNTAARMAGMLAIAALTAIAVALFSANLADELGPLALSPGVYDGLLANAGQLAHLSIPDGAADSGQIQSAIDRSYINAYRAVLLVCAVCAAAAAATAWLTLQKVQG